MRRRSVTRQVVMQRMGRVVEKLPRLYIAVQKLRSNRVHFAGHIVRKGDALLIDAFPRSGSSFALKAFRQSNPDIAHKIGTHMHSTAHVSEAVRLRIPALVLIRDPDQAIPSLLALGIQSKTVVPRTSKERLRATRLAIDRYVDFHSALLSMTENVLVVDFSQITADYGSVLRQLNARFGTRFNLFDHTPENAAAIMRSARRHLGPDPERDEIKARLQESYTDAALTDRRRVAKSLYDEIRTNHVC